MPAELPAVEREVVDVDLAASSLEELILEANNRYANAQEALLSGDWAAYGAELESLEMVLERMLDLSGLSPEPEPTQQPTQQPVPSPTPAAEESSG